MILMFSGIKAYQRRFNIFFDIFRVKGPMLAFLFTLNIHFCFPANVSCIILPPDQRLEAVGC